MDQIIGIVCLDDEWKIPSKFMGIYVVAFIYYTNR